jgi:hypothetical protein
VSNDLECPPGERMERKRPRLRIDARKKDPQCEKLRTIPRLDYGERRVGERSSDRYVIRAIGLERS